MKTQHFFIVLAAVAVCFTACKKDEKATPVTGITLNYEKLTLIPEDTITLIATVQPNDADNKTVIWKSSKPDVATVNSGGLVTAVANGEATITATAQDGNKTVSCMITVDYRNQWVGDWDFVVKCEYPVSVIYYSGKIFFGNVDDQLNIEYTEHIVETVIVDEYGKISAYIDFCSKEGQFERKDELQMKVWCHEGQGGGDRYYSINGMKKEGDKK